jgi:hypothetical protein
LRLALKQANNSALGRARRANAMASAAAIQPGLRLLQPAA